MRRGWVARPLIHLGLPPSERRGCPQRIGLRFGAAGQFRLRRLVGVACRLQPGEILVRLPRSHDLAIVGCRDLVGHFLRRFHPFPNLPLREPRKVVLNRCHLRPPRAQVVFRSSVKASLYRGERGCLPQLGGHGSPRPLAAASRVVRWCVRCGGRVALSPLGTPDEDARPSSRFAIRVGGDARLTPPPNFALWLDIDHDPRAGTLPQTSRSSLGARDHSEVAQEDNAAGSAVADVAGQDRLCHDSLQDHSRHQFRCLPRCARTGIYERHQTRPETRTPRACKSLTSDSSEAAFRLGVNPALLKALQVRALPTGRDSNSQTASPSAAARSQ